MSDDVTRWWVASHSTQHSQIVISQKLLADCQTEVSRIRTVLRYLLGVISDLEVKEFDANPPANYFDQFIVNETNSFLQKIFEDYNSFRYNHVAQSILYFISNKVSGLYCHCIKDRLYCAHKSSPQRKSAQLTAHTILVSILRAIGPILPHLVEEVWHHHPLCTTPFYFTKVIPTVSQVAVDVQLMSHLLDIKKEVSLSSNGENLRTFDLYLKLGTDLYAKLAGLNICDGDTDSVICEVLEVSSVSLQKIESGLWEVELRKCEKEQCLRCRKYNAMDGSDRCVRCDGVLAIG